MNEATLRIGTFTVRALHPSAPVARRKFLTLPVGFGRKVVEHLLLNTEAEEATYRTGGLDGYLEFYFTVVPSQPASAVQAAVEAAGVSLTQANTH